MNLLSSAPLWLVLVLAALLIAAAVEDVLRLRISNIICGAVVISALVAMVLSGGSWALWQNLVGFVLILVLGTFAFSAGLIGGGDVKLLAGLLLWVDLGSAFWLLMAIFLAGGVAAIISIFLSLLRGIALNKSRKRRIPYGVPIALGALTLIAVIRGALG